MNWRRGLIRVGIVVAVFVVLPVGAFGYLEWREQRDSEIQLKQILREEASSPGALYQKFLRESRQGGRIPDARIISRAPIPMYPTINWIFATRLALVVLAIGASFWWVFVRSINCSRQ